MLLLSTAVANPGQQKLCSLLCSAKAPTHLTFPFNLQTRDQCMMEITAKFPKRDRKYQRTNKKQVSTFLIWQKLKFIFILHF